MILGLIFSGEPSPDTALWYVWAAIGENFAFCASVITALSIMRRLDKKAEQAKEENE